MVLSYTLVAQGGEFWEDMGAAGDPVGSLSGGQTDHTINGDKRGSDMAKMVTTTYTQWSLNSIYGRDDVNRLRRIFATLKQLAGEALVKEWALNALWDASARSAPECSSWLAKIAAGERSRPNPPALHIAVNNGKVSAGEVSCEAQSQARDHGDRR